MGRWGDREGEDTYAVVCGKSEAWLGGDLGGGGCWVGRERAVDEFAGLGPSGLGQERSTDSWSCMEAEGGCASRRAPEARMDSETTMREACCVGALGRMPYGNTGCFRLESS